MKDKKPLDLMELFEKNLGEAVKDYDLPPPSFEVMRCGIIEFDSFEKRLITKMPVLHEWLNPYGTMQGGMIAAAVDNAVGPLSMLMAEKNMTRGMELKYLKPITLETHNIFVTATLVEEKKRRLTFDVVIMDKFETDYVRAKVVNYII